MPAHQVTISVDGATHNITPGLVQGTLLLGLVQLAPNDQLLFEVDGDIDIPVSPTDLIALKGGETFSIGDGCPRVSDNPIVRKGVKLTVNDQELDHDHQARHAKLTGAEIKARAGTPLKDELWLDLKGLADERVDDAQSLILRDGYLLFTKKPDKENGGDCCEQGTHTVRVSVNSVEHSILAGNYAVSELKRIFGVPADYDFDQVRDGKFTSISDETIVSICGGEVFVSHVCQGASS